MNTSDCPTIKKVSLLTIGIFAPSFAMASPCDERFEGFYAGLMGGVSQTNTRFSETETSQWPFQDSSITNRQANVHQYSNHGIGSLYLGYGNFYDEYLFWAVEIFANLQKSKNILNNFDSEFSAPSFAADFTPQLSDSITMKLRNAEFGADFKPGYLLDINTLLYGRIGVAFNKVTLEDTSEFSYISTGPFLISYLSTSDSRSSAFVRLGLGLEHKVSCDLSMTADYIYTYYGKLSMAGLGNTSTGSTDGEDSPVVVNPNGLSSQTSGKLSTNAVMLGVKYYFTND